MASQLQNATYPAPVFTAPLELCLPPSGNSLVLSSDCAGIYAGRVTLGTCQELCGDVNGLLWYSELPPPIGDGENDEEQILRFCQDEECYETRKSACVILTRDHLLSAFTEPSTPRYIGSNSNRYSADGTQILTKDMVEPIERWLNTTLPAFWNKAWSGTNHMSGLISNRWLAGRSSDRRWRSFMNYMDSIQGDLAEGHAPQFVQEDDLQFGIESSCDDNEETILMQPYPQMKATGDNNPVEFSYSWKRAIPRCVLKGASQHMLCSNDTNCMWREYAMAHGCVWVNNPNTGKPQCGQLYGPLSNADYKMSYVAGGKERNDKIGTWMVYRSDIRPWGKRCPTCLADDDDQAPWRDKWHDSKSGAPQAEGDAIRRMRCIRPSHLMSTADAFIIGEHCEPFSFPRNYPIEWNVAQFFGPTSKNRDYNHGWGSKRLAIHEDMVKPLHTGSAFYYNQPAMWYLDDRYQAVHPEMGRDAVPAWVSHWIPPTLRDHSPGREDVKFMERPVTGGIDNSAYSLDYMSWLDSRSYYSTWGGLSETNYFGLWNFDEGKFWDGDAVERKFHAQTS